MLFTVRTTGSTRLLHGRFFCATKMPGLDRIIFSFKSHTTVVGLIISTDGDPLSNAAIARKLNHPFFPPLPPPSVTQTPGLEQRQVGGIRWRRWRRRAVIRFCFGAKTVAPVKRITEERAGFKRNLRTRFLLKHIPLPSYNPSNSPACNFIIILINLSATTRLSPVCLLVHVGLTVLQTQRISLLQRSAG